MLWKKIIRLLSIENVINIYFFVELSIRNIVKLLIILPIIIYIGLKFLNKKIIIENDVIILFSLLRNSKSFQYIDELGYYYFRNNNDSFLNTIDDKNKANRIININSQIYFLFFFS